MKTDTGKNKQVLISGASIAGLSTAWYLKNLGYAVTIVETAAEPRVNGAAVDIRDLALDAVKRTGLYDKLKAERLTVERIELKNAADQTEGLIEMNTPGAEPAGDEIEIERDKFVRIMLEALDGGVEFVFNDRIGTMEETAASVRVGFLRSDARSFDLVIGCDGIHSGVRKVWFGHEQEYAHYLGAYFAISITNQLLVPQKTMQMFNVPDKAVMLNAYNGKTDIILCFHSDKEIDYDYRNAAQQRRLIATQFAGIGWRTGELLDVIERSGNFYFDKFCQIRMPSWTKGRVALVGDAGYSASPAAGMGASLSIAGAGALADALEKENGNIEKAFAEYNRRLRPFITEVQATAEHNLEVNFVLRTEEAIRQRNAQAKIF